MIKASDDVNDTLRKEGPAGVRARSDRARKHKPKANGRDPEPWSTVQLEDFRAYMPLHKYIFSRPERCGQRPASMLACRRCRSSTQKGRPVLDKDAKQKAIAASAWLDQNRPVEQMTWAPGEPMEIKDRLISDGGWIERPGLHRVQPLSAAGHCSR